MERMEKMNPNRPLVTMHIACYNQEWCIRETLEGAFSQTYSPLDIVVSDDCSTDRTWQIVQEMVERYRREDGRHNVILNRNPENSYRATYQVKERIRGHVHSLWRGELIVQADGDDISLPNRVEETVRAWDENGRRADMIICDCTKISVAGDKLGYKSCHSIPYLGATMTYTRRCEEFFGSIGKTGNSVLGDIVRKRRAEMLGGVIYLEKPLVKYRVGSSFSQVTKDFRKSMCRLYQLEVQSFETMLQDSECIKSDAEKYTRMRTEIERDLKADRVILALWKSERFPERWNAYRRLDSKKRFSPAMLLYGPLLLLPHGVGDPLLELMHRLVLWLKRHMLWLHCR